MSLPSGTRLGHYDIVSPLGKGGMGEVYRATDSKLKRPVAVKILPPALAADPDRLARFQREAEVLASLNHPHIAGIYRLEDTGDMKALVMELVEGPTLADRIAKGPIPIDEALPIAQQIAEALEAAHERGIIHRDLKPANIKVRDDGTVKVLDFGLAKLAESSAANPEADDLSGSPTLTSPAAMTELGVILGTATYMSPEQARGRAVDKRTDIWAFGAVLYEMLTGARAFDGEDITDVIASVVKSTPDWSRLPPETPASVVTLVQRCLDKDRKTRIGDIAVARFLLAERTPAAAATASPASVAAARPRASRPWLAIALLGLGLPAGIVLGWLWRGAPAAPLAAAHLQMSVAPADALVGSMASVRPARTAFAISPDGRSVAFSGTRGTTTQLYVRGLDRAEAAAVPGTEGATGPFFSPDGAWIGFWTGRTIKKVSASGGPPAVVADVPARAGSGTSWSDDGWIYFETSGTGISRVPATGGAPATITRATADADERHLLPHALPGGHSLLFTVVKHQNWDTAQVVVQPAGGGERRVLIEGAADARYVATGHLLYVKQGTLMAVAFDAATGQVSGEPAALIENVMQSVVPPNDDDETGAGQFAISRAGTLLYAPGGPSPMLKSTMVWVDRRGGEQPLPGAPPGTYYGPRLSPDGQKIAVAMRRGTSNRETDLWLYDVSRGVPTRLTFDGGGQPVWSPDGKRLIYSSGNLRVISADGSGKPEPLTPAKGAQWPLSWAGSPGLVAFLQPTPNGTRQLWILPMDGEKTPRLFTESTFELHHPALSPDGRLVAYVSTESGTPEIYVQPYPGPGEKTRVSTVGGFEPIWSSSGKEILFRSGTYDVQQFFSAAVRSLSPFRADAPQLLFTAKAGTYDSTAPERSWDVTPDGKRFLLTRAVQSNDRPVTSVHVVLNWAEELKRVVPVR